MIASTSAASATSGSSSNVRRRRRLPVGPITRRSFSFASLGVCVSPSGASRRRNRARSSPRCRYPQPPRCGKALPTRVRLDRRARHRAIARTSTSGHGPSAIRPRPTGDCGNRRKVVQRSLAICGEGEKSMRERDRPVLVVDGDEAFRGRVVRVLRRAGLTAIEACDGEGIRALDDTPGRGRARGRAGGRGWTRGLSRASRATRRGSAGDHGLE